MQPLQIALIGVGGIGSSFAYQLALAGHSLTVIPRPNSLRSRQLKASQSIKCSSGNPAIVSVRDNLDQDTPYDIVIVTLLAHQVDEVLPSLQKSQAKCFHFLFNNFNPERLQEAIGADRTSFGMPFLMASLDDEGTLTFTVSQSRKTLHSDKRWVNVFNDAGIASAYEPNMLLWLRCHAPICIAMESLCFLGECRHGGATWQESLVTARGLHAGFRLIKSLGYKLYPTAKVWINACPTFIIAALLWSITRTKSFRVLLATGVDESRAMVDTLLESCSSVGVRQADIDALKAMKVPK